MESTPSLPWRRRLELGAATLYLGDCLEILPALPSRSVDMIWTDPPYGHDNNAGDLNAGLSAKRGVESRPIANDGAQSMRRVVDGMLGQAVRLLADEASVCCCCAGGGGPRPTFAWLADRMDRGGLSFFHSVIWDKINPGLGWRWRRQHEMVMVAHRAGGKLLWADPDKAQGNVVSMAAPAKRRHPNEKPLALVALFLRLHAKPGQLVLDPFMGSGTTGEAALKLGLNFVGIELDEEHFETAARRLQDLQARPSLFEQIMDKVEQGKLDL